MKAHEKICVVCGATFLTRTRGWTREKFCGSTCNSRYWNKRYYATHRKDPLRQQCVTCGDSFVSIRRSLTCSRKCNQKRQDERRKVRRRAAPPETKRSCARCQSEFVVKKWGKNRQRYCSEQCRVDAHRAMYLQRTTLDARLTKSRRIKWGGAWLAAMQRDGWKCRKCGKETRLLIHHIDGSGEAASIPNHDLSNLMTLCYACHNEMHTLVYRIIDGEVYVAGPIFDWLGVGDTVKVLRRS